MFEEMHLAGILHKGINGNAECIPAADVINMATVNGAQALGFDNVGRLMPGQKADIIIIDLKKPHLCPLGNVMSALVYSAQGSDVRDVIVDGQILMKNRELTTVDEEKAMYLANKLR
jgi:5-methylthioadenosine/S-adenosylhomocysteine deaminase